MAYEQECDIALMVLDDNSRTTSTEGELYVGIKEHGIEMDNKKFLSITSILISEGFLHTTADRTDSTYSYYPEYFTITDKGRAFLNTDKFVDRKARWDLEKKTNILEYSLKKRTFAIAVAALVISILTFLKSSCNDKADNNKNNQPPTYNQSYFSNPVIK